MPEHDRNQGRPGEGRHPWYHQGLRFACTQCGRCCTGRGGYVWVTAQEIACLADFLGLGIRRFGRRYLRRIGPRYALLERPGSGDCTFLVGRTCSVYDARPGQCRRFPWWERNLRSPAAWARAAEECEGIAESAPLVSCAEIEQTGRA